jgi:hypothetical protein
MRIAGFAQFINEILNSSYNFSKSKNDSYGPHHVYHFKDDESNHYRVHIEHGTSVAAVNFSKVDDKGTKTFSLTGNSRSSHKVLGTVSNILRSHASNHPITHYTFTASDSEPSRVKLYSSITKKHGGASEYRPYNKTHNFIVPANKE